jgi:quercetin dioxygenase-like cupin family protein
MGWTTRQSEDHWYQSVCPPGTVGRHRMRRTLVGGLALMVAVLGVTVGVATATPPEGSITPEEIGNGTIAGQVRIRQNPGESTLVFRLTFGPGSSTGWHSHPGKTVVIVQSGQFTLYRASDPTCTGTTYEAGEGFVEPRTSIHIGRNEGSTDAVLAVVYFRVPVGGSPRIDQPDPGTCDF